LRDDELELALEGTVGYDIKLPDGFYRQFAGCLVRAHIEYHSELEDIDQDDLLALAGYILDDDAVQIEAWISDHKNAVDMEA
jgi:hypothetical protein